MKLNKPKYSVYKNLMYAFHGLLEIFNHEISFKLEIVAFFIFSIIAWSLHVKFIYFAILVISLFIPILAEVINSAIERIVDLITIEYKPLAKRAKDAGAALVLLSLIVTTLIWIFTLLLAFGMIG